MITEINHNLTDDERNTLLFLTGHNKVLKKSELSPEEHNNLQMFFGWTHKRDPQIIKLIIKRDVVITKVIS